MQTNMATLFFLSVAFTVIASSCFGDKVHHHQQQCMDMSTLEMIQENSNSLAQRMVEVEWKIKELIRTNKPISVTINNGNSGGFGFWSYVVIGIVIIVAVFTCWYLRKSTETDVHEKVKEAHDQIALLTDKIVETETTVIGKIDKLETRVDSLALESRDTRAEVLDCRSTIREFDPKIKLLTQATMKFNNTTSSTKEGVDLLLRQSVGSPRPYSFRGMPMSPLSLPGTLHHRG